MYKGAHLKRTKSRKKWILLVSLVMLLTIAVGGTLAYITDSDGPLANIFKTSQVPISVLEDSFDGTVKNNVTVRNDGNTDAYIRVAVVATWRDSNDNIYAVKPEAGVDYQVTFPEKSGWSYHATDGFYYYTASVAPNGQTGVLLTNCKPLKAAPADGYTLCVEIVAESIQAKGVDNGVKAVVKAWGVDPEKLQ